MLAGCQDTTAPDPAACLEISLPAEKVRIADEVQITVATRCRGLQSGAPAWSSSDTLVAAVSPAGVLEARSAGSTTVSARIGEHAAQLPVTVVGRYRVVALGDSLSPAAINERGEVVGTLKFIWAFLWRGGTVVSLGLREADAYDINDAGVVVGRTTVRTVTGTPSYSVERITENLFRWQEGSPAQLREVSAGGVRIVSAAVNGRGEAPFSMNPLYCGRFCTYDGYGLQADTMKSVSRVKVTDVNEQGTVVGLKELGPGYGYYFEESGAVAYSGGAETILPGITSGRYAYSAALGINDRGEVVGYSGSGERVPVRWTAQRTLERLPLPAGFQSGQADRINNRGEIVGSATPRYAYDEGRIGLLWQNGRLFRLDHLTGSEEWTITSPRDINDRGQIVAMATHRPSGVKQGVLLDPQ